MEGLVCVLSAPGAPAGPTGPAVQSGSWSDAKCVRWYRQAQALQAHFPQPLYPLPPAPGRPVSPLSIAGPREPAFSATRSGTTSLASRMFLLPPPSSPFSNLLLVKGLKWQEAHHPKHH